MKIYFASYSTSPEIFPKLDDADCLLESYWAVKSKDLGEYHKKFNVVGKDIFLDSGAFSAFSKGVEIDIDAYCAYIKKFKSEINVYASLDVIGDYKATGKNLAYMEGKGLNPLPVFHHGSPFKVLEELIDKYDYIALGGLVPLAARKAILKAHLNKCFHFIFKKYQATGKMPKIHGFGMTNFNIWKLYPFYSVDSTSWTTAGRFRYVYYFEKDRLKSYTKNFNKTDLKNLQCHKKHYHDLNRMNVLAFLKAGKFITRLWETRGIKFTN